MNTSLARRQRHRRNGNGRRHGGGTAARRAAIALPLFLFGTFILLGFVGFVGAVVAYNHYSQGLPNPKTELERLAFSEETVIYDRSGKQVLARFAQERRQLANYEEIPPVVIDATTSVEDKSFWDNAGFDPAAIISATLGNALQGSERGASTITQQLVRARLLPKSAFDGSPYERKIKEIIQSVRLTQELPEGVAGKQQIMAAYLNQNYYGNQSYGIKAAALSYFGVADLSKLTLAQAAILAAIPKSPTNYDLVKNAEAEEYLDKGVTKTRYVVPPDSEIVQRRNKVLELMKTRSVLTAGTYTAADYDAAMEAPVYLVRQTSNWQAPHFVWQVRKELGTILCGKEQAESCEKVDTGGYRVTTTLDWNMQKAAVKWTKAAAIAPNVSDTAGYLAGLKVPYQAWIKNLRGRGVFNAAMAALDYRTGQILAYVGSADYYGKPRGKKFQPQYDVLSDGWRQPGSAFKPVNYVTGLDDRTLTAASLFMDVVTNFGSEAKPYEPADADLRERGPLRLREALQMSLNIPAVKAAIINGPDHVFETAKRFGIRFQAKQNPAGSSIGIGTLELHYIDLLSAYGTIANGGELMPRTTILSVLDSRGNQVWPLLDTNQKPAGTQVVSEQAAYVMTDILAGNTDPKQNPFWGRRAIYDGKTRRQATLKTGTTNDQKDLAAFGYLAPPDDPTEPAIAVGAWMGNSDNSIPPNGTVALESSASLWQAFLTEVSKGLPMAKFGRPDGIAEVEVDAHSGMLPGPFTERTITEVFIDGTQPTQVDTTKVAVDIDEATGLRWQEGCQGPMVTKGFLDLSGVEPAFPTWRPFTDEWITRAMKGPGTKGGPKGTRTAYFSFGSIAPFGATWGADFAPTEVCTPVLPPSPEPTPEPTPCDPFLPCDTPLPSLIPEPTPFPTPGQG